MTNRWGRTRAAMVPAAVAAGALLLSGCAGNSAGVEDGTVELKVAVWSNWDFVQRAADAYTEEHPDVKITVDAISGDDYFSALPRTLATSGSPDITVLQVIGTGSYQDLVAEGGLVDVSSIWDEQGLEAVTNSTIV